MKKIWTEYKECGKMYVSVIAWYDREKTCTLRVEARTGTLRGKRPEPEVTLETHPTREAALRRVMQLADMAFWFAERGTATETDAGTDAKEV